MKKIRVSAEGTRIPPKMYSQAIVYNGIVYVSGQLGRHLEDGHLDLNDPSTLYADAHGESKKFKAYYQSLAEENGISFLDTSEYAEASPIDSIHLTKESHIALEKAVAEKLKEMFR
ncbi:MAG: hypothetical protein IJF87_00645 [Erysipelotrichaceae bacterium]|nr:hypothetical protein [Erysipelotrichaceae bacterium]